MLIDDLITRGTAEPYRMFTSRAEYRLLLREDNADLRLSERAHEMGLLSDDDWVAFTTKRESIEQEQGRLKATIVHPSKVDVAQQRVVFGKELGREYSAADLLRRPDVSYGALMSLDGVGPGVDDVGVQEQIEIQARYSGYIERQSREIERQRAQEDAQIPDDLDYASVRGLSAEVSQKLALHRPATVGQAARIDGVTPAAISLLLVHLHRHVPERMSTRLSA